MRTSWDLLNKARIEFGETIARGSEPDVIIRTENALYFIEAKLTATNNTEPSNPTDRKTVLNYFNNKTIGYNGNGYLQKAFSI